MKKLNYCVVCAVALATLSVGVSSCEGRSGNRNSTGNSSSGGGSSGSYSSSSRSSNPYVGTWQGRDDRGPAEDYYDVYEVTVYADGTGEVKQSIYRKGVNILYNDIKYDITCHLHSESYHEQVYEWITLTAPSYSRTPEMFMTKDGKVYSALEWMHKGSVNFTLKKIQ